MSTPLVFLIGFKMGFEMGFVNATKTPLLTHSSFQEIDTKGNCSLKSFARRGFPEKFNIFVSCF